MEQLTVELGDMDLSLRAFMAAEQPERGVFHAGDIHRLRQEKVQKRLELEYCQARIRFLESESTGTLH
jgi:hypothetical protein